MPALFRLIRKTLILALIIAFTGAVLGSLAIGVVYWLIAPRLPSVEVLRDVRLQVPLRVYSTDGKLVATFGETRRIPVRIDQMPEQVKQAFIAVEDARFYEHPGFDWQGIVRAIVHVVRSHGEKKEGASTITQQVARNFFLSPEQTYTRKLSEIFLALRIEKELSKNEILELYLNKIFLGHRAYGIAAAAELYYGKTLSELTLAECAMLASLPKSPSTGNPLFNRERAVDRRNYVLERMREERFITEADYKTAIAELDRSYAHEPPVEVEAPYLAEMVRQEALERLGNEALTDGYVIKTTLNSHFQEAANQALRKGLIRYDQRHGYRGAEAHVDLAEDAATTEWSKILDDYYPLAGLAPGLVTQVDKDGALVYLSDGQTAPLDLTAISWARPHLDENRRGTVPKRVDELLKPGDIVRVARDNDGKWQLSQLPQAQSALVALRPDDGAITALVGGFSFARNKFNRVTQSNRQPGSSFKPFIYAAAFEHGFTPASIVNDAPVAFADPSSPNGLWAPKNDDDKFAGPIRLREALTRSKNLVSVRLLDAIGVRYAREYITRFGLTLDQIPENLSMALGTASVSPMVMARGYAVFANGGFLVDPYFIEEIDDRDGNIVFRADPARVCRSCPDAAIAVPTPSMTEVNSLPSMSLPTSVENTLSTSPQAAQSRHAPRVIDTRVAYLVSSLMRDVVRRGTGHEAMVLKRNDLAGKTGSTNDYRDAWFTGFNDQIAVSTWTGFDDFSSLGHGEFGAKAALPIWIDFMREALKGIEEQAFNMPPGVATARIDPATGLLASSAHAKAILEVFKTEDIAHLSTQTTQSTQQNNEQREAYDVF